MFRKKFKIEVVPESDYTDFSDRLEGKKESELADKNTFIMAGLVSSTVLLGCKVLSSNSTPPIASTPTIIPVSAPVEMIEPVITPISQTTPLVLGTSAQPVGYIADASLNMLANVLDPLIQIMVAISFPIASVIMVGSCFFFMFGDNEKAWSGILKAGMGYVLIQLSPLFLDILRNVGNSVAQN